MISVSVLIPSDGSDQYLLKVAQGRGWWLVYGNVSADSTAKSTAQRIATEVRFCNLMFLIFGRVQALK